MSEKLITSRVLSVLLNLAPTTMDSHLGRFSQYMVQKGGRYYYKYTYYFLRDLKRFYEKKMFNCNSINYEKFNNIITILDKLMNEI